MHIEKIKDTRCLSFSIFFHDVIYKALRKNNEEKSAEVAEKALKEFNVNIGFIQKCKDQINSTNKHIPLNSSDTDCQLLIDFDLEILSRDWERYKLYTRQIRKEYKIVPYPIYRKGRKEAMLKFLKRDTIFYTEYYQKNKEEKARENIKREIDLL